MAANPNEIFFEYVFKQVPIIIFMCFALYYMKLNTDKLNEKIDLKDAELKKANENKNQELKELNENKNQELKELNEINREESKENLKIIMEFNSILEKILDNSNINTKEIIKEIKDVKEKIMLKIDGLK